MVSSKIEPNKKVRTLEVIVLIVLLLGSLITCIKGISNISSKTGEISYVGEVTLQRNFDEEDYDEDYKFCDVLFEAEDKSMAVTYTYEDYEELDIESITAYEYKTENGVSILFDHENPSNEEIIATYKSVMANESTGVFNLSFSLGLLFLSVLLMFAFGKVFTTYEKCWFITIMALAAVVAVIAPEESANGVNGIVIMILYLLDTFFNILCELLISKQSRYNFLVSVLVEIVEIVICVVLMYRFATMITTLFFWLPIDILSFINWSKHKDDKEDELTVVRKLKGYQEVLVILGIVLWTFVVGYLISGLDIATDFLNNRTLEIIIIYLDACASAVGIANGLFIFFRLEEQWIAWYICAALESAINILAGQYVLLVLKLGYFTNTTYGYIKWNKYIKSHAESERSIF